MLEQTKNTPTLVGHLMECLNDAHSLVIDKHCCTSPEQVGPLIGKLDRAISAADGETAVHLAAFRNNLAHEYGRCETIGCAADTFMDQPCCWNHAEISGRSA